MGFHCDKCAFISTGLELRSPQVNSLTSMSLGATKGFYFPDFSKEIRATANKVLLFDLLDELQRTRRPVQLTVVPS